MRTPELPRGISLIFLVSFLLLGLPSVAAAQSAPVPVPGTGTWTDTHIDVVAGDLLEITAAGFWTEGDTTNGPDGTDKPWADNFFNVTDLGVCMYCAQTHTPFWGALIGYIGSAPPAPGSYTSAAVFRETTKIFYVGADYAASAPATGRLWLNKNTDAYSNYTVTTAAKSKRPSPSPRRKQKQSIPCGRRLPPIQEKSLLSDKEKLSTEDKASQLRLELAGS